MDDERARRRAERKKRRALQLAGMGVALALGVALVWRGCSSSSFGVGERPVPAAKRIANEGQLLEHLDAYGRFAERFTAVQAVIVTLYKLQGTMTLLSGGELWRKGLKLMGQEAALEFLSGLIDRFHVVEDIRLSLEGLSTYGGTLRGALDSEEGDSDTLTRLDETAATGVGLLTPLALALEVVQGWASGVSELLSGGEDWPGVGEAVTNLKSVTSERSAHALATLSGQIRQDIGTLEAIRGVVGKR